VGWITDLDVGDWIKRKSHNGRCSLDPAGLIDDVSLAEPSYAG